MLIAWLAQFLRPALGEPEKALRRTVLDISATDSVRIPIRPEVRRLRRRLPPPLDAKGFLKPEEQKSEVRREKTLYLDDTEKGLT